MSRVAVAPNDLADWLIDHGKHVVTTGEAAGLLGVDASTVPASLKHARRLGKLVSISKGVWVPVPPGYRSAGAPPASHFVDALMAHLGYEYYVGLLSAAALHGASHQSPMVFQVVTPARLRDRQIGRNRIQFVVRNTIDPKLRQRLTVPTGRLWVSTPEATLFDLVASPHDAGGLSNVATICGDLLSDGSIDQLTLAVIAKLMPQTIVQRLGFLIDYMAEVLGIEVDTEPLRSAMGTVRYRELAPGAGDGERNERWRIIINAEIEHDL